MDNLWVYILGFGAQALFSARVLVQWLISEKQKRVVSPTIYWQLSLFASILFSVYGWLRGDFAIIIGQIFTYYIYIWNLKNKNVWQQYSSFLRWITLVLPFVLVACLFIGGDNTIDHLFKNISFNLLIFGTIGQIIFTLRFVYQWWYSYVHHESLLPIGFWVMSIAGAAITVIYGIYRRDPVLILGHGVGLIVYSRNLWLMIKSR